MMAIRMADVEGEPLGVLVVCSRSMSRFAHDENALFQALRERCVPLRMLLVCRRLARQLVSQFLREWLHPQASGHSREASEDTGAVGQIEQLYCELTELNRRRSERPEEAGLQGRIKECLAALHNYRRRKRRPSKGTSRRESPYRSASRPD